MPTNQDNEGCKRYPAAKPGAKLAAEEPRSPRSEHSIDGDPHQGQHQQDLRENVFDMFSMLSGAF